MALPSAAGRPSSQDRDASFECSICGPESSLHSLLCLRRPGRFNTSGSLASSRHKAVGCSRSGNGVLGTCTRAQRMAAVIQVQQGCPWSLKIPTPPTPAVLDSSPESCSIDAELCWDHVGHSVQETHSSMESCLGRPASTSSSMSPCGASGATGLPLESGNSQSCSAAVMQICAGTMGLIVCKRLTSRWSPGVAGRPPHRARCRPVAHQAPQGCPWSLVTPTPALLLFCTLGRGHPKLTSQLSPVGAGRPPHRARCRPVLEEAEDAPDH